MVTQRDVFTAPHAWNAGVDDDEDARFSIIWHHRRDTYNVAWFDCGSPRLNIISYCEPSLQSDVGILMPRSRHRWDCTDPTCFTPVYVTFSDVAFDLIRSHFSNGGVYHILTEGHPRTGVYGGVKV